MTLTLAHTADVAPATLDTLRTFLYDVFEGEFEPTDWEHALGGMHVFARTDDGELVGHGSVVQRRLLHGGRALRCGYVESIAVRADHRREGIGEAIMTEVNRIVRGAYDLGALGATDAGARLYRRTGWTLWQGPLRSLTPDGIVRTPDADGGIWVLQCALALDVAGDLVADWREGDVW